LHFYKTENGKFVRKKEKIQKKKKTKLKPPPLPPKNQTTTTTTTTTVPLLHTGTITNNISRGLCRTNFYCIETFDFTVRWV